MPSSNNERLPFLAPVLGTAALAQFGERLADLNQCATELPDEEVTTILVALSTGFSGSNIEMKRSVERRLVVWLLVRKDEKLYVWVRVSRPQGESGEFILDKLLFTAMERGSLAPLVGSAYEMLCRGASSLCDYDDAQITRSLAAQVLGVPVNAVDVKEGQEAMGRRLLEVWVFLPSSRPGVKSIRVCLARLFGSEQAPLKLRQIAIELKE